MTVYISCMKITYMQSLRKMRSVERLENFNPKFDLGR